MQARFFSFCVPVLFSLTVRDLVDYRLSWLSMLSLLVTLLSVVLIVVPSRTLRRNNDNSSGRGPIRWSRSVLIAVVLLTVLLFVMPPDYRLVTRELEQEVDGVGHPAEFSEISRVREPIACISAPSAWEGPDYVVELRLDGARRDDLTVLKDFESRARARGWDNDPYELPISTYAGHSDLHLQKDHGSGYFSLSVDLERNGNATARFSWMGSRPCLV